MNKKTFYISLIIFFSVFFHHQAFASQTRLYGNIILPEIPKNQEEQPAEPEKEKPKDQAPEVDESSVIEDELILLLDEKDFSTTKKSYTPLVYEDELVEQLRNMRELIIPKRIL